MGGKEGNEMKCSQCETCKKDYKKGIVKCDLNGSEHEFDHECPFFEVVEPGEKNSVNHPSHYAGKYECIDVMQDTFGTVSTMQFCLLNAFKYLWRCQKKHESDTEDVKKAVWYLNKYLELEGGENDGN